MAYTPPDGDLLNLELGSAYTPPDGDLLNLALDGGGNQVTAATLGELTEFGTTVATTSALIAPLAVVDGAFGTAQADNFIRYVYTIAIDAYAYGGPTIENLAFAPEVAGIPHGSAGVPTIENLLKLVYTPGITPRGFGDTDVSHFLRYIDPNGIPRGGIGSLDIEFLDRGVDDVGGIPSGNVGSQLVWRELYIAPLPWESSTVSPTEEILNNVRRSYLQGFDSLTFGTAVVYNSREMIYPGGWNNEEFLNFNVRNNTRFVGQFGFLDSNSPPDVYGVALIENVNRTVNPYGYPQTRFGYTFVYNNAEPFYPAGLDHSTYGSTGIDLLDRTRAFEGWESSTFSPYAAIYNTAFAVQLTGIGPGDLGVPSDVVNLNRTVNAHTPPEPPEITGVGIDFALRYVGPYSVPLAIDAFPTVRRNPEFLAAIGFEEYRTGGHAVHEHFNEIRPSSANVPSVVRVGEPYIYNLNRPLLSNGVDQSEYGTLFIENAIRTLTMPDQGINSAIYGTLSIEFRTKHIGAGNIPAANITTHHHFTNAIAGPPGPSDIIVPSFGYARYGTPWLPHNRISGVGDIAPPSPPPPAVRYNSIYTPVGFDHDDKIGTPRCYLYRGQINPTGIPRATDFGTPRLSPNYIRPLTWPRNVEGAPINPNNFGDHRAYTAQTEMFTPYGIAPPGVPAPDRVELKKRYIRPDGLRSLRIGYARFLNVPQFIELLPEDSIAPRSVGTPVVSRPVIPYTGNYTVDPNGFVTINFGSTDIELFHRTVTTVGVDTSRYGTGMVGTTRWRAVLPFENTRYGTQRVEFLIRTVEPIGELETLFETDDDIGSFPRRTYVTRRAGDGNQSGPSGIPPPGFGAIGIALGAREITFPGINASGVPRPRVGQPRSVVVPGWGGEVFGRADHWQGDLIPYSIGPEAFGLASTGMTIAPLGIDSLAVMGTSGATRRIRTYGFPPVGFHGPLLLDDHGRNLQFIAPLPVLAGVTARPEVST